ncbi:MAG TPA: NFACT RNA binding domain-containing protein [bacterium]|nr:NFACT RNA binding domain-containing protein [bacterium]
MISNHHSIARWVMEARSVLVSARIMEIFCQQKNLLQIGLVTPSRQSLVLEIYCDRQPYIVWRSSYSRKNKNSMDLFPMMIGLHIRDIVMDNTDRRVILSFENGCRLVAQFYGSANVWATDASGVITGSFKNERAVHESSMKIESGGADMRRYTQDAVDVFESVALFREALSGGFGHLNKILTLEFLHAVSLSDITTAREAWRNFINAIYDGAPRIYTDHGDLKYFSLLPLTHHLGRNPHWKEELFTSVNDAFLAYVQLRFFAERLQKKRDDLLRASRQRIKKNEHLIMALQEDAEKAATFAAHEQKAHLLNIHLRDVHRGMDKIVVTDVYDEAQNEIEIKLDPILSPQANVEKYFAQSKKLKQSVVKIAERILTIGKENDTLRQIEAQFADAHAIDRKALEKKYDEFVRNGWIKKTESSKPTRAADQEMPVFREFRVHGNWRVFVGQNDIKNDALTFRFAKKDDLWFHARGVAGSHVVLKRDGRSDNPGQRAIEAAAQIAAFFSKAKTSSLVPVAYTERKYLRKPKGAKPGMVVLEREEVLMVPPVEPREMAV